MNLDKKDRKLLYSLDFDARASYSKLAKIVQLKKETVQYRVKKLEKDGIIESYYLIPNTPKLGLVSYKVLIKYQSITKEIEVQMIDYLKKIDQVGWIVKTEGIYDLMLIIWTKNEITFDNLWIDFLSQFSKYFYVKEVLAITANHAFKKNYLIESDSAIKEEVYYRDEAKIECDKTGLKIIYELSKNSRTSTIEIGQKLNMTPEAISYRIKSLVKKNIIQTFRPKINLEKIGYLYYNILINVKDFSVINEIKNHAKTDSNITYFVKYLGKYDIGVDVEVENPEKFKDLLDNIRACFGHKISTIDFVRIYKEEKITYGLVLKTQ